MCISGMPPVNVVEMYDSTLADGCQALCDKWTESSPLDLDTTFTETDFTSLTTAQKISFLSKLYQIAKPLSLEHVRHMGDVYKIFSYNVSVNPFSAKDDLTRFGP